MLHPSAGSCGSSPLSRGILMGISITTSGRRFIPALAGNTSASGDPAEVAKVHPRSRGEYGILSRIVLVPRGSSPLSRGIRLRDGLFWVSVRFIPALAGNTTLAGLPVPGILVHPRSRGEYSSSGSTERSTSGSSPLSRGILGVLDNANYSNGFIPALAGNTGTSS